MGGAVGPTFEARAVDLSEEGMHVRSAYVPEPGQQLTCRFEVGESDAVLAAGEVVWVRGDARGGEVGVRFTDMDADSVDAIKRACADASHSAFVHPGSKVRLHIEGLASPMRAKIRNSNPSEVIVGSDLGFLQVGKPLELEEAQHGMKRPARIDGVEVHVDSASRVPQLLVTLRYQDVDSAPPAARSPAASIHSVGAPPARQEAREGDDLAAIQEASAKMKGVLATKIAGLGPAVERFARRAKTTIALLAARKGERGDEGSAPRRTTAPPPGGGLHATGRRVVRGDAGAGSGDEAAQLAAPKTGKRKLTIAVAVMLAAVLGALAIKKLHPGTTRSVAAAAVPSVAAGAPTPGSAPSAVPGPLATQGTVAASAQSANPQGAGPQNAGPVGVTPSSLASAAAIGQALPSPSPDPAVAQASAPSFGSKADEDRASEERAHKRRARVTPFSNGRVRHGNVLRLKMDGPIEAIEGAQQPTGFIVKIPGRKSLEPAAPLAEHDARIGTIRVSNDAAGAELTVAFKDGVPNYRVSAREDTLIISLARGSGSGSRGVADAAEAVEAAGKASARAKHDRESSRSERH
jgi:hypothetical protein